MNINMSKCNIFHIYNNRIYMYAILNRIVKSAPFPSVTLIRAEATQKDSS